MRFGKISVIVALATIISLSGCLSENDIIPGKGVHFDIKPSAITVKSGDSEQFKVRVTNNGNSTIRPFLRFNMNSSDKQYVRFDPASYDFGSLRPGEDSGFRIVDIKADIAAGNEIKYTFNAELVYENEVHETKEFTMTVKK